jgi:uncharacterized protein (TIGR03437 family)
MNQDFTTNGPSNPAALGSIVSLWGTGLGTLNPPCATGALNPDAAVDLATGLGVIFWDSQQQRNYPLYVGSAPTLACGVEQINLQLPIDLQPGAYQLFPWSTQNRGDGSLNANQGAVGVKIFVK